MEYFDKNLNMAFSGSSVFRLRQYSGNFNVQNISSPSYITVSTQGFNIQKFKFFSVKFQLNVKGVNGASKTYECEYRANSFDATGTGATTFTLNKYRNNGFILNTQDRIASYQTKVTIQTLFLRAGLPNNYFYNFDNAENSIDFTDAIPLTLSNNQVKDVNLFLNQNSDIRIWSLPEFDVPVYSSQIFANHKMVTLPIIVNGQNILRLKCKQGYQGSLTDVISKYRQNSSLNKFVPVILTNGGLKSIVSSEYNEDEDGEVFVTTTVPDKITLGPLNEHGSDDPYYYSGGNLYYKTVVFTDDYSAAVVSSVKYNFTSFDSSTRKIVFSLDNFAYQRTKKLDFLHIPGDVLSVITGLSFKLDSFYGESTTSPESNMVILKEAKLYTSDDTTVPTYLTLNYNAPASFQSLMAWNGRNGNRYQEY